MDTIIHKLNEAPVLDVDKSTRRVKLVISEMGTKDYDDEIIEPGAWDKTIKERGPIGKNLIYHLFDHGWSLKQHAINKFSELYVEGNRLVGVSNMPDTTNGNDAMKMYEAKLIDQHSAGFSAIRTLVEKDQPKKFLENKLYEGSAVLWGANENTPTLSVGKMVHKMGILQKELKDGTYTDENFELLEYTYKQIQMQMESLRKSEETTHAALAPEPSHELKRFADLLLFTSLKS